MKSDRHLKVCYCDVLRRRQPTRKRSAAYRQLRALDRKLPSFTLVDEDQMQALAECGIVWK